ncbi:MAG: hypothetical protein ACFHHU_16230 [Porticoccaceae bacterium]|uniref:hypothetical protein n=1 Tax=Thalassospira sp. TaxID=1912094 RepID=UPI003A89898E
MAAFLLGWMSAGPVASKVYYVDLEGNISEKEKILVSDKEPIDVVSILDIGTNTSEIEKINKKYIDNFNFINPGDVVPVYAVVFSLNGSDGIVSSMSSSGRLTNKIFYEGNYVKDNSDCLIRVIHDDSKKLQSFNMFVFDGNYKSYELCLSEFYHEFRSFHYNEYD